MFVENSTISTVNVSICRYSYLVNIAVVTEGVDVALKARVVAISWVKSVVNRGIFKESHCRLDVT